MPGNIPNDIYIFRITHYSNLDHILQHGMNSKRSGLHPHYVPIGNEDIISKREGIPVRFKKGAVLNDYIPFYFGYRSPMLYVINKGDSVPQNDIIYICCKVDDITGSDCEWFFTDGNAAAHYTEFYSDLEDLEKVDWDIVYAQFWFDTEDDDDRMRKKAAEFLILNHVPIRFVNKIVVYNQAKKDFVEALLDKYDITHIEVLINPKNKFYY